MANIALTVNEDGSALLDFSGGGEIRESIRKKECYCTNEIFMWSSIVYQPVSLGRAMIGAKVWEKTQPLPAEERVDYSEAALPLQPAAPTSESL